MSDKSKFGQKGVPSAQGNFNSNDFHIQQALGEVRTNIPVKVIKVYGGGVGKPPTVDVQVMANQVDGVGTKTDHGVIYNIPVSRNQGGLNAVINDPVVGDIGFMAIADRDISAIKANDGGQSNPGSKRRFNLADGVFQRGMLNPANPDQFIFFREDGITIKDKNGNAFEMNTGGIIEITGTLHVTGDVISGFGNENISALHHVHSGITPGGANTDEPVPS